MLTLVHLPVAVLTQSATSEKTGDYSCSLTQSLLAYNKYAFISALAFTPKAKDAAQRRVNS
jgi:hypothetical protein